MGITKYFSISAGILTGVLVLIIAAHFFGFTFANKKIIESCQGEYIKYNSYDPYCLSVIKQLRPLGSNYIIMISRKGNDNFGHVLNYIDPDPVNDEEILNTRVIWSSEGIEMTF
ncbi:MAG TPA: hypothetical protein VGK25_08080, partial [Ignavibacteria bacterium]